MLKSQPGLFGGGGAQSGALVHTCSYAVQGSAAVRAGVWMKKTATAVAHCKRGNGLIKVNGRPLEMIEPRTLQYKLLEPVLLLGKERFAGVDIRVRVKGGGHVAQIYGKSQDLSLWV